MSNVLTTDKLINSIKRRAMIPSDQNTFTDQDFLDMLNEEIQYFGVPHLLRTHEEYLVTFEDVPLVAGQTEFDIPYRAIGNKLREVTYKTTDDVFFELSRISLEDLADYNDNTLDNYTEAFYVQGNKIILVDDVPFGEGVLRFFFYLKPNTLVDEDRTAKITAIDTVAGTISLDVFPEVFSSVPEMDLIKEQSPNKILAYDLQPLSVNQNTRTVTFAASDIPEGLAVGDFLCLKQETPVPQLPTELHAILAQRVAVAALEALGDMQGMQMAQGRLDMMEKSVNDLIDNRVEGAPEKINSRHSPLRDAVVGSHGYRRRGRF